MNIFVGNLSFEAKEMDVYQVFMAFGKVGSVSIVMEKRGKKSRGFGFVEMPEEIEAQAAIAALDGKMILGRPINVMISVPKTTKSKPKKQKKEKPPVIAEEPKVDFVPERDFKVTGAYKQGRRTRSFLIQRARAGITTPLPERKYKPNPMRWRKNQEQPKSWRKKLAEPALEKPTGEPKPPKPWKKFQSNARGNKTGLKGRKKSARNKK